MAEIGSPCRSLRITQAYMLAGHVAERRDLADLVQVLGLAVRVDGRLLELDHLGGGGGHGGARSLWCLAWLDEAAGAPAAGGGHGQLGLDEEVGGRQLEALAAGDAPGAPPAGAREWRRGGPSR